MSSKLEPHPPPWASPTSQAPARERLIRHAVGKNEQVSAKIATYQRRKWQPRKMRYDLQDQEVVNRIIIKMSNKEDSFKVQAQIRRNAEEQNEFFKDLGAWEKSMKKRDRGMASKRRAQAENVPVRPSGGTVTASLWAQPDDLQNDTFRTKSIRNKSTNGCQVLLRPSLTPSASVTQVPVSTFDGKPNVPKPPQRLTLKELEDEERQRGNNHYKAGNFPEAIKCYTRCIGIDSKSAVVFSNRAMTYLKMKDWAEAEEDATSAIEINPWHVKSYQRRATARTSLGKLRSALKDLHLAEVSNSKSREVSAVDIQKEKLKVERKLAEAVRRAPKRKVKVAIVKRKVATSGSEDPTLLSGKVRASNEDLTACPTKCKHGAATSESPAREAVETKTACVRGGKQARSTPKTWYEFESVWTSIISHSERVEYLSLVTPAKLSSLYKNGIENVDVFVQIIIAAADTNCGADYLRVASRLRSVSILVMMMTDSHRIYVRDAVRKCFVAEDAGGDASEVASKLGC